MTVQALWPETCFRGFPQAITMATSPSRGTFGFQKRGSRNRVTTCYAQTTKLVRLSYLVLLAVVKQLDWEDQFWLVSVCERNKCETKRGRTLQEWRKSRLPCYHLAERAVGQGAEGQWPLRQVIVSVPSHLHNRHHDWYKITCRYPYIIIDVFGPRHQTAEQNHNTKAPNNLLGSVAKSKYFGPTVTNQNWIHEGIQSRLNSWNVRCHAVQKVSSPACHLRTSRRNYNCTRRVWNFIFHPKARTRIEGVWEQGADRT
jgi:hypothetical protein